MILHACVKDDEWRPRGVPMPHRNTAQQIDDQVDLLDGCGAAGCCLRIMLHAQRSITQWHERQRTAGQTHPSYSSLLQAQHQRGHCLVSVLCLC